MLTQSFSTEWHSLKYPHSLGLKRSKRSWDTPRDWPSLRMFRVVIIATPSLHHLCISAGSEVLQEVCRDLGSEPPQGSPLTLAGHHRFASPGRTQLSEYLSKAKTKARQFRIRQCLNLECTCTCYNVKLTQGWVYICTDLEGE